MSTSNPHRKNLRALTAQGRFALVSGPAAASGLRGAFGLEGSLPQDSKLDSNFACAFLFGEGQR